MHGRLGGAAFETNRCRFVGARRCIQLPGADDDEIDSSEDEPVVGAVDGDDTDTSEDDDAPGEAADALDDAADAPTDDADDALDAASLAKLGYRELQAECKRRGLLAIGRREELIGRLAPEAPA